MVIMVICSTLLLLAGIIAYLGHVDTVRQIRTNWIRDALTATWKVGMVAAAISVLGYCFMDESSAVFGPLWLSVAFWVAVSTLVVPAVMAIAYVIVEGTDGELTFVEAVEDLRNR